MALTEAVDTEETGPEPAELERREAWLAGLHDLYEFFSDHPDLIPVEGAIVAPWYMGEGGADRVRRLAGVAGPLSVSKSDGGETSYVLLSGPSFGPHSLRIYASREQISTPVERTKTVTEFEFDPDLVSEMSA